MYVDDPQISPKRMRAFLDSGQWSETTSNERFEALARSKPDKLAIVDGNVRLTYAEYFDRCQRLAAHFIALGLTDKDVIAVQLPNWCEVAIVLNAAMLAGIPFTQFHSDFRSREVQFICEFTEATLLVVPHHFRDFHYLDMIEGLRPTLPKLQHVYVVGSDVPDGYFNLQEFLAASKPPEVSDDLLVKRRPHGNDLCRTAFTSGTTGDPKAVLHLHNTTNVSIHVLNREQQISDKSVFLVFLPIGLNWGLFNMLQSIFAGCTMVLQERFDPRAALQLIEHERVTHFCCAPAHLIAMLGVPDLDGFDLSSLQNVMTGGASCPVEVIGEVRRRLGGHLLEMYGMLEAGTQCQTRLAEDPEKVCGTVGRSQQFMSNKIVDDGGHEVPPGTVGEIWSKGPSIAIGYYKNRDANARSFSNDSWFHTGDQGVMDVDGYFRIVGRKKEMLIRGGANIYPREIEEVLYQHPKIADAAIIGLPDPRLGERVCACIVPKSGETLDFGELTDFLRGTIATYKLPEFLEILRELPLTPTGKIQKGVLREQVLVLHADKAGGRE
jgi:acyl-CoA synthetase (AMP-forming)/AMP-acid ligase II